MSEDNKKDQENQTESNQEDTSVKETNQTETQPAEDKVKIIDGKATPTEETVQRTIEKQSADPSVQTTSEPSDSPASELQGPTDEEKEAKAKAAAEARAARAKERAAAKAAEAEAAPKEPSPNQPRLDRLVQIVKEQIGDDAVSEAYINELNGHMPTLVMSGDYWLKTAELLRDHNELTLDYLRNVSGVDYETHMEVDYFMISTGSLDEYCVKVKTDRDQPSVPSATPVWETANWQEREIYDLLGVDFPGHPDLRRIMLTDDWVGHPLRKDYEPIDPEV